MAPYLACYPYLPLEDLFPEIAIPVLLQRHTENCAVEAIVQPDADRKPPTPLQTFSQKRIKKWLLLIQEERLISLTELAKLAHVCTKTFINILQNKTHIRQATANRIGHAARSFLLHKKSLKTS